MPNPPILDDDESPYAHLTMSQRVSFVETHLLCAAIVGSLACVMLFFLGHISYRPWVMFLAVASIGCGYISQVAAANAAWTDHPLWRGAAFGSMLTGLLAWLAGAAVWLFQAVV